jgi:hypothetical protein
VNRNTTQTRLQRLHRECDVSVVPALLLLAACFVLVLILSVDAVRIETSKLQAGEPAHQPTSPAPQASQPATAVAERAMSV